ncbi:MAG: HNH endonuclease [Chitinophagales bacterium]
MIFIERLPIPPELTPKLQQKLTTDFKNKKIPVWKQQYIQERLLEMSHGKCVFCETRIDEESKYMEIEHFHSKDKYQEMVVEWDNLLPVCRRCNAQKGNWDVVLSPIIDPTKFNPKNHLQFDEYRLEGKDDLGKQTIEVLALNDFRRLVSKRFEVGEVAKEQLITLNELTKDYTTGIQTSTRRKNRMVNGLKYLLSLATAKEPYSATMATIILYDANYQIIKQSFEANDFWDEELVNLEKEVKTCALDKKIPIKSK